MTTLEKINQVVAQVSAITGLQFVIAETLPSSGIPSKIYLVSVSGVTTDNLFDVYIYTDGQAVKITSEISLDLSGYVSSWDLGEVSDADIDRMFSMFSV